MKHTSFDENLEFDNTKIQTKIILETSFSKEIRILLKENQVMKEHKAPFPIIVHILSGRIDFGVNGKIYPLKSNDILSLDANIPHDLRAMSDSIVRLTLSKEDKIARVNAAADI